MELNPDKSQSTVKENLGKEAKNEDGSSNLTESELDRESSNRELDGHE